LRALVAICVAAAGVVTLLPIAPAVASTPSALSDATRRCQREPVFGETVCLYEFNPEAERTVVLVHGIGNGALHDWEYQLEPLAGAYHVLAIDLPGFGESSQSNQLYSPDRYAEVVAHLVRRYSAERPVSLIGHSMGGLVSLIYAARYPHSLDRLVVVDVAGVLQRLALSKQATGGWLDRWFGEIADSGGLFGRLAGAVLEDLESPLLDPSLVLNSPRARERVLRGSPHAIAALAVAATDLRPTLPAVETPTLIIWGKNDDVSPLRVGSVLKASLADARLAVLESGHVPMRELPAEFNELVLAYLASDPAQIAPTDRARTGMAYPHGYTNDPHDDECRNNSKTFFEGRYAELTIVDCTDVVIRNATIEKLDLQRSRVTVFNTSIENDDVAVVVSASELRATATDISGRLGIRTANSRLDLAAVSIFGRDAAVEAESSSTGIFSVSKIASPHGDRAIHEFVRIEPGAPL
jgi:pimeloyl-ACP methyl ester carboxylesterase